jgi:hypothetical protein
MEDQNSKLKTQNLGVSSRCNFYLRLGIFILLLVWLSFLMAQKVDLTTADLGRHLQNGRWVVENHFNLSEKDSPVHENFYSYTNQDFQVPNHHWGSGVLFYLVYKLLGFSGLSLFYIFLSFVTFSIFFLIAKQESNFTIATILSLLLIPLMAERREIRPEVFSYFFAGVFLLALWSWQKKELITSRLYILPILMIFWVNLHVYFFLGLFLIGVYWFVEAMGLIFAKLSDKEFLEKASRFKNLSWVLVLSILASLISPFGLKGLLYPLQIFKNYGYTIVENKSVWFVENYGIVNSNFMLIKVVLILMALSFVLLYMVDRKKMSIRFFVFAVFFGAMGWLAIRNFTLLGFFALPILALNFENIFTPNRKDNPPAKENGLAAAYITIAIFAFFASYQFVSLHSSGGGVGLLPGNEAAGEFLKTEKITEPIFNNYDIGGYLTWNLSVGEKVFVDNRPEAYPDSFFSDVYKPMQENPDVFKKVDERYNFNAIVFTRNDITPWGMNFLKTIKDNSGWAKVFEDNYAVIYLKKNEANQEIINRQYEK